MKTVGSFDDAGGARGGACPAACPATSDRSARRVNLVCEDLVCEGEAAAHSAGTTAHRIGHIHREPGLFLLTADGERQTLAMRGFDHFST